MKRIRLLAVLVLAGCGSTGGVDEATAEAVCRQWCLPDAGSACGGGDPVSCLDGCVRQSQETCGEHHHAQKVCQLGMDCEDPFQDCSYEAYNECVQAVRETCLECEDPQLCFDARGDCPLVQMCIEMCPIQPEACVSNGGGQCGVPEMCYAQCPDFYEVCVGNDGKCPQP